MTKRSIVEVARADADCRLPRDVWESTTTLRLAASRCNAGLAVCPAGTFLLREAAETVSAGAVSRPAKNFCPGISGRSHVEGSPDFAIAVLRPREPLPEGEFLAGVRDLLFGVISANFSLPLVMIRSLSSCGVNRRHCDIKRFPRL